MFTHRVGDMLNEATSGIIIHGCNCQGVMGGGIAKLIRAKWPDVYNVYRKTYENYGGLELGDIIPVKVNEDLTVINCMTQKHFGTDVRHLDYEAVVAVAAAINKALEYNTDPKPVTIHTPLLGAGLAGGNWNIVETILDEGVDERTANFILWTLPGQELPKSRIFAVDANVY